MVKLYPPGAPPNVVPTNETSEPVLGETYDEVVFTDPNESFYRQLMRVATAPKIESSQKEHLTNNFSDEDDFVALIGAEKFLQEELENVKERFRVVSEEYQVVDHEFTAALQKRQQQQAASKKSKGGGTKRGPKKAKTS
eukprot:scaffold154_cov129-Cylindrotheca_fusiformis.AAC.16